MLNCERANVLLWRDPFLQRVGAKVPIGTCPLRKPGFNVYLFSLPLLHLMPYVQRRSRNPTQLTARQLAHLTTIPKLPSSPLHPPPTSQTLTSQPHRFDAPSSRTLIIEEVNGITRVIKDERSEGTVKGKEDQRQEGDRVDRNEHVENESNKVMPSEDEGRGRSDSIVKDITNDSTCSLRRPGSKRAFSLPPFFPSNAEN